MVENINIIINVVKGKTCTKIKYDVMKFRAIKVI